MHPTIHMGRIHLWNRITNFYRQTFTDFPSIPYQETQSMPKELIRLQPAENPSRGSDPPPTEQGSDTIASQDKLPAVTMSPAKDAPMGTLQKRPQRKVITPRRFDDFVM